MKKRADSANIEQRLNQMLSKLKEHNFRLTPQRLAVLKVLAVSEGHPTVERIYETVRAEFPTTSIATIYKTVNLLKQLNEVLELGFPDRCIYPEIQTIQKWIMLPYEVHSIATREQKVVVLQNFSITKDTTI